MKQPWSGLRPTLAAGLLLALAGAQALAALLLTLAGQLSPVVCVLLLVCALALGLAAHAVRTVRILGNFLAHFDPDQPDFDALPPTDSVCRRLKFVFTSGYARSVRQYKAELLEKQVMVSALQSQINPHFLYNTLECIRSEALLHRERAIAEMIETLANFFRYSISRKGSRVTIAEELENVQNYFKIQQYRYEEKFQLVIDFSGDDDWLLSYRVPKLMLQPLVENAIFHGLEARRTGGQVLLRFQRTDCSLLIHVSDNGTGMPETQVRELNDMLLRCAETTDVHDTADTRHNGIALLNINRQLQLLYGAGYGLRIKSTQGLGTEVEILLPIEVQDAPEGDDGT